MIKQEEMYPCADCGKLRTKAEGGTTFTVCEECWDKRHSSEQTKQEYARIMNLTEEEEQKIEDWLNNRLGEPNIFNRRFLYDFLIFARIHIPGISNKGGNLNGQGLS